MNIKGFTYIPNFLSSPEEEALLQKLRNLSWEEVKMYGVTAKRKVVHFGLNYTYYSRTVTPTVEPPRYIMDLIERSASILKIFPNEIVETLITFYSIGAGIGWHKDAAIFGNKIFGISLQNECTMKFRKKSNDKYEVIKKIMEPRSAYILSDEARSQWEHSISPLKKPRYSITFRMNKY